MSDTPYAAPQSHVADIEVRDGLEVSWGRAVRVWWSITWRTVVFGALVGFVVGLIAGIGGNAAGVPASQVQGISSIFGVAIGALISIWAVRKALTRSFSGFRIVLLPK
jgi:LytS/YehU family sensor histidine kinase